MKIRHIFLVFCTFLFSNLKPEILFVQAAEFIEKHDGTVDQIIDFDQRVSFEFFKPLYQERYQEFNFGKNPDEFLQAEMIVDRDLVNQILADELPLKNLILAYDQESKQIAGVIIFSVNPDETCLTIDLILVAREFRRHGVGRRLIKEAIASRPSVFLAKVYSFNRNEGSLAFYSGVGFERQPIDGVEDKIGSYGVNYREIYVLFRAMASQLVL